MVSVIHTESPMTVVHAMPLSLGYGSTDPAVILVSGGAEMSYEL